jgi:hypothetical protein
MVLQTCGTDPEQSEYYHALHEVEPFRYQLVSDLVRITKLCRTILIDLGKALSNRNGVLLVDLGIIQTRVQYFLKFKKGIKYFFLKQWHDILPRW